MSATARQVGIAVTYLIATSPDELHCHASCAWLRRVDGLPCCDLWQQWLGLGEQQQPVRAEPCAHAEALHEKLR